MSQVTLQGNASGTGIFTIAAPNSNTNRTLNLPDAGGAVIVGTQPAGDIVGTTATQTLTNKTLSTGTAVTAGTINGATIGATTASTGSFTSLTDSGNLAFTGTGNRITGDFSNATVANRVMFQTSTVNGNTRLGLLPNGTATITSQSFFNAADPSNAGFLAFAAGSEAQITSGITGTGTYLPMTFQTGGTERVRITSAGNVGIGTSSPASRLQVVGQSGFGGGAANSAATISTTATGNDAATLELATGSGSPFSMSLFAAGASPANAVSINQRNNAPMMFFTNNTERMRINSIGQLLVNTTVDQTANHCAAFRSNGNGFGIPLINSAGSIVGSIIMGASTTTFNTSSDYRLKHDIQPMSGALAKVAQLKPVTYKWNSDDSQSQGFIAHELQEIVPECVTGEKDAVEIVEVKDENGEVIGTEERPVYQGIDTSFLVATLTAALQEAVAEINALKARLDAANL